MIIYKNRNGFVASFLVAGIRVNVVDNERLMAIQMAIDYIYNANSK